MSDLADLQARDRAARSFSVTFGTADAPRVVQLLEPTMHEVRLASLRAGLGGASDPAALAVLERALLAASITGWTGVTSADLLAHHPEQAAKLGDAQIPFAPGGVDLLCDAQPQWGRQLWAELLERLGRRGALRETAAKN